MISMFTSTIAAVSTPHGKGGVAVIRISGNDAIDIASNFIKSQKPLSSFEPRYAGLCRVVDTDGTALDDALVTVFRAPHSYTGEDVVEISCHGSEVLCREILRLAFRFGAEPATAGEFTRRAFAAGKLTLTEAESVIDVIDAKSRAALALSRKNLDGALSIEIDKIYQNLKETLGSIYAGIDFPEEDLEVLDEGGMERKINEALGMIARLENSYKAGHAVIEGVPTVICGKPNVGKSTILNVLMGEDRAIVTDIPGTTRDVVSGTVVVGDVTLDIRDTAGIRRTDDALEKLGISKSVEEIEKCELVIGVYDMSRPYDDDDKTVTDLLVSAKNAGKNVLLIYNKSDLEKVFDPSDSGVDIDKIGTRVTLNAKSESARGTVGDAINKMFIEEDLFSSGSAVVSNARQHASLSRAGKFCKDALTALHTLGSETAGLELEHAMSELAGLDGREVGIDIVNDIFGRFCVGK